MARHVFKPTAAAFRGHVSRALPPVLTIRSGDTVSYTIPDALWGLEPYPDATSTARRCVEPHDWARDGGHCLAGPVAIRGLKAGQVLAIEIGTLVPGTWGWTLAGGWSTPLNERLRLAALPPQRLLWDLDAADGVATNQFGHRLPLRPFLGFLGLAPAASGDQPTTPPRATGGNLDCRELITGATLYLPAAVDGGWFCCGDVHAAQGDGEIGGTAVECLIERAELRLRIQSDLTLTRPLAHTPAGWVTFGLDADLETATCQAIGDMLELMIRRFGLSRQTAAALASAAVSLRLTQLVNDVRGVHAILPHDVLGRQPAP